MLASKTPLLRCSEASITQPWIRRLQGKLPWTFLFPNATPFLPAKAPSGPTSPRFWTLRAEVVRQKVSLFCSLIYFSAFLCLVAERTNEEKKLKGKFLRKLVEFDLVLEIPNKKKFSVNDFYMGLSHLNS